AGDSYGQNNLGRCYEDGKGVAVDLEQALVWYQKSADADNLWAKHKVAKTCPECYQIDPHHFLTCNSYQFQRPELSFDTWTSDNKEINDFIRFTQKTAKNPFQFLEWIPYDQFSDIHLIGRGGFGSVSKASWLNGYIFKPIIFRDNVDESYSGFER